MRILVVFVGCLALSGCAQYEQYQRDQAAAQEAGEDGRCQSYGARPGTDAYIQCRMNLSNQIEANRRAVVGAILANQAVANQPAPVPRQQNCTSTINGQIINTTCN